MQELVNTNQPSTEAGLEAAAFKEEHMGGTNADTGSACGDWVSLSTL